MTTQEPINEEDEATLLRLGFEPRYYLCMHPAWPDPLQIWPPTAEEAQKTYDENVHPKAYVLKRWERGPQCIVHAPRGEDD